MSTLTQDVEATGMSLARSMEAQQHRACKSVARKSAGAHLSSTWCSRMRREPSRERGASAAWLVPLRIIEQAVPPTLGDTIVVGRLGLRCLC